jgi:hypothetical protein
LKSLGFKQRALIELLNRAREQIIRKHNTTHNFSNKMRNTHRIPEAIADLESQEAPNISATAVKYGLDRTTLGKRWKGKMGSMEDCISTYRQCLTNSQERALIQLINRLTNRGMPPMSRIVKNLAEEIRGSAVGKN